ncbi:MAG TPA: twin-arginine translocation signal domain-containing protein [Gemmataceae bacterium]|nr:twin-arginine translocation signal domain-containing protein [Gemmataceae bacterium]
MNRRSFLQQTAAGALAAGIAAGCGARKEYPPLADPPVVDDDYQGPRQAYKGPNVVLVRFGGGVRRLETIAFPEKTYCPFIYHELYGKNGVLFPDVEIAPNPGIVTSHGQGTLYLMTGRYDRYEDISHKPFADRFVPKVPTIFEYLRRYYDVPEHQALIVNGEDRIDEEFYTFSNNHVYGVHYRSQVLSLYKFKTYLLREELKDPSLPEDQRQVKLKKLQEMVSKDYRTEDLKPARPEELAGCLLGSNSPLSTAANLGLASTLQPNAALDRFWAEWKEYYGTTGLVNPRGDRLLTALAQRALRQLRPRLLMINYQDPDYVHWGNPNFYTQAISIIDDGVRQIWDSVQADPEYRDNTVFVVVPDCGRDNNRCVSVPFQHHFGSRCAHEIFAIVAGPKRFVPHESTPIDRRLDQTSVAATVGQIMRFAPRYAAAPSLFEKV